MQKRAQIALSALISLSATVVPAYATDANKRSVAQFVVPPAVPAVPSSAVSSPVSSARVRQAVRNSYPAGHLQRGMYLKQKGDRDAALIEFLKAAQENPNNIRAFYEQALIFKEQGLSKLAQSSLQQALSIKPDYKDARVLLASLYLESGDLNSASQELIKTLGLVKTSENNKVEPEVVVNQGRVRRSPMPAANPIDQPSGSMHLQMASPALPAAQISAPISVNRAADAMQSVSAATILPSPVQAPIQVAPVAPVSQQVKKPDPFADAISDLLKGIPGLDPNANIDKSGAPKSVITGASDNPVPKDLTDAIKTVTLKGSPAQALIHAATASQESAPSDASGGIHLPNLFGFFHHAEDPSEKARAIVEELKANRQKEMLAEQKRLEQQSKDQKKIEKVESQEQPTAVASAKESRRERKGWLTAWLDNLLDSSAEHAVPPTSSTPAAPEANSVKVDESPIESVARTIARQADQLLPKKTPQPPVVQNNYSDRPIISMAMPAASIEPPSNEVVQQSPPLQSWLPAQLQLPKPVDLSEFIKKAMSWLPPMPVFKPLPLPEPFRASLPPVQKIEMSISAPSPVPGMNSAIYSSMMSAASVPAADSANVAPMLLPSPQHVRRSAAQSTPSISFLQRLPFLHKLATRLLPHWQPTHVHIASGKQLVPIAPSAVRTISGATNRPQPHMIGSAVSEDMVPLAELPPSQQINRVPVPIVPAEPPAAPFVRAMASDGTGQAPVVQPQLPPSDLPPLAAQTAPGLKLAAIKPKLAPHAEQVAERLSAKGFKFVGPQLTSRQIAFVAALHQSLKAQKPVMAPVAPAPPEDAWVTRMKYLLAHGTANMRPGEAFMFSEATGEGVIFLRDGTSIRRMLAAKRSDEEVIRQRRPDLLKPQVELQYNLSLLGKIIKPGDHKAAQHQPTGAKAPNAVPRAQSAAAAKQLQDSTVSDAKPSDFLDNTAFFGWLKGVFRL